MFTVYGYVGDVLMLKAIVCGGKSFATVVANLHTFTFRADHDALWVLRVDQQRVDNPVSGCYALEILVVHGLPQSAGRSCVQNVGICGIHANDLGAAEGVGNALIFNPLLRTIRAVVNARASRSVN